MNDTDARPRIGIVIASLEAGGAQRMALAVARALLETGHSVRVYSLDRDRQMALPTDGSVNPPIITLGTASVTASTLAKARAFPKLRRRLRDTIEADRIEMLVSFMERANILCLTLRTRLPLILSVRKHLSMALRDKDRLKRTLVELGYRLLLTRADHVNFNSHESARDFKNRFGWATTKISVIPNFVPPELYRLASTDPFREPAVFRDARTVVTVGRLRPVKGHFELIRAFADLHAAHPDVTLVIIGEGPARAELEQLIAALRLERRVHLTGFLANPYPWIKQATLFILSSHAEGFPNALLEAMALGRPVIATDCPSGTRELLAPDTDPVRKTRTLEHTPFGLLTPPLPAKRPLLDAPLTHPERALRHAMAALLTDSNLCARYARRARGRSTDYDKTEAARAWTGLVDTYRPIRGR